MKENNPKIKTYVISLKNSVRRRDSIKQQFNKYNINYEFVDAVKGIELDIETDSRVDQTAVRNASHWLTPGAIGCALSHLECYRRAIAEDLDFVVIFEDDAKVVADYTQYLDKILMNLTGRDVALMYHTSWDPVSLDATTEVKLDGSTSLYHVKDGKPLCATAYIMNRDAYRAMESAVLPVRSASDKWEFFQAEGALDNIACVFPHPIDTMDFKSDIGYLKSGWKAYFSDFVDQNKIFPFYQILRELRRRSKLKMKQVRIA